MTAMGIFVKAVAILVIVVINLSALDAKMMMMLVIEQYWFAMHAANQIAKHVEILRITSVPAVNVTMITVLIVSSKTTALLFIMTLLMTALDVQEKLSLRC